jgi:hypothetical protein
MSKALKYFLKMDCRAYIWMAGRCRRLSKHYEGLTESSQALIYAAIIRIMIKRVANARIEENENNSRHALRK